MLGCFAAITIWMGFVIASAVIYKKETGRNFFKDLYNDMFNK